MLESIQNFDDEIIKTDEDDRILKFGELENKPTIKRNRIKNPTISIDKWSIY
jgi:hypothetical protein